MAPTKYAYLFTGQEPEEFPTLAAVLAAREVDDDQPSKGALVMPGEIIHVDEPILHARLAPHNEATRKAHDKAFPAELEEDSPAPDVNEPAEPARDAAGITPPAVDEVAPPAT